jgi:hypothetical protein
VNSVSKSVYRYVLAGSKAGEVGSDSGEAFWKLDGDPSDRLNRYVLLSDTVDTIKLYGFNVLFSLDKQ